LSRTQETNIDDADVALAQHVESLDVHWCRAVISQIKSSDPERFVGSDVPEGGDRPSVRIETLERTVIRESRGRVRRRADRALSPDEDPDPSEHADSVAIATATRRVRVATRPKSTECVDARVTRGGALSSSGSSGGINASPPTCALGDAAVALER